MTEEQKQFIRENRLFLSMTNLGAELNISRERIRNFMIEEDLILTREEISDLILYSRNNPYVCRADNPLREEDEDEIEWVFDFWNYGLNPITMRREND